MIKSEDPLVVWLLYVPILVTCTKYFLVVTSPHLLLLKPFFGLIPILHVLVLKWLSNFVWSSLILLLVKSIFLLVTSEFFLHNSCFVEIPGNVLLPSLFMNRSILIWLVDLSLYRSKKHLHCMTPHDFIPYAHHGFYGGSPPKIRGKHYDFCCRFSKQTPMHWWFLVKKTQFSLSHMQFFKMIDNQIPILVKYPFEGFLSHRVTPSHHPFIDGIFHL